MLLKINHETRYNYDKPVQYGLQQLRLRPKERPGQRILDWNIEIEGGLVELSFEDQHCNHVDLINIERGRSEIVIRCTGEVENTDGSGVIGAHAGFAPLWYFKRATALTRPEAETGRLIASLDQDYDGDIARLHALSALVTDKVAYKTGETNAETTAEQALSIGGGVCQDQHIGWVGFDVSNGYSPDERYVRVATGLDYRDASPITGLRYGAGGEDMIVSLQVQQ